MYDMHRKEKRNMGIKFTLEELDEILEAYAFEKECIMDSCDTPYSPQFVNASVKHTAVTEIRHLIHIAVMKKLKAGD